MLDDDAKSPKSDTYMNALTTTIKKTVRIRRWILPVLSAIAISVACIIANYTMEEPAPGVKEWKCFVYQLAVVIVYMWSIASALTAAYSFLGTWRLLGGRAVHMIPFMLDLRRRSRHVLSSARRYPWWFNTLLFCAISALLGLYAQSKSSSLAAAFAVAALIGGVGWPLINGRVPVVLHLGPSTPESFAILDTMCGRVRGGLVASLLDAKQIDSAVASSGRLGFSENIFRIVGDDMATWFDIVRTLAGGAGVVVFDARITSGPVSQEARWMVAADLLYKTVAISLPDGTCPVFESGGLSRGELASRGALVVSETDLLKVVWQLTGSRAKLPTRQQPALSRAGD